MPIYSVRFEGSRLANDMDPAHIVGPGFSQVTVPRLAVGQRVFVTHHGREVEGRVTGHVTGGGGEELQVLVDVNSSSDTPQADLKRRVDEVRLWASRKSARLADSDTDFALLADFGSEKRRSPIVDIPVSKNSGRKRRASPEICDLDVSEMNECTAAMVLMSLSVSPKSPRLSANSICWSDHMSEISSGSSELLSELNYTNSIGSLDEGIDMDEEADERRRRVHTHTVYKCTWPKCRMITSTCSAIERHVRTAHLGSSGSENDSDLSDHEEEFYYTELEISAEHGPQPIVPGSAACPGSVASSALYASPPPTLSHMDMARPPHEDPQYRSGRQTVTSSHKTMLSAIGGGSVAVAGQSLLVRNNLPNSSLSTSTFSGCRAIWQGSASHQQKYIRLGPKAFTTQPKMTITNRRPRGDVKKCRKVYGMEHREQWCTQCKWKKACTRFAESG